MLIDVLAPPSTTVERAANVLAIWARFIKPPPKRSHNVNRFKLNVIIKMRALRGESDSRKYYAKEKK